MKVAAMIRRQWLGLLAIFGLGSRAARAQTAAAPSAPVSPLAPDEMSFRPKMA